MTSLYKNISLSLALVSLLFVAGGCDSFLEPERDNVYDEETLLRHPSKAEGILLGAYSSLPGSTSFTDVATDNAVSNNNGNSYRKIVNGELSAENDPFSVWAGSYTAIATLNHFLSDIVDNVVWSASSDWKNEHFRTRLTAEAKGLRAFYYIRLLEAHSGIGTSGALLGVPMVLESVTPQEGMLIKRSTYEDCVSKVLEDLTYAEKNLPMVYSETVDATVGQDAPDKVEYDAVYGSRFGNRFSGISARMLKARLLYNAACPAFNLTSDKSKWEAAAKAAAEVIDYHGGVVGLTPDRIEYYKSKDNLDVLWRKNFSNSNSWESSNFPPSMYGSGRVNPSQNLVDAFPAANGYPITMTESGYNPLDPYAGRDPRLAKYILYNGAPFKRVNINTVNDTQDGVDAIANKSTRTGYYLKKMMDEGVNLATGNVSTTRHFVTLLRYTEAYLIYAEAALNAYGATGKGAQSYSATDVIKAIRTSAGLTDSYLSTISDDGELMKLIRNERRIELAFESDRYWDIRRHKDLDAMKEVVKGTKDGGLSSLNIENRVFADYMIYGPVPFKEARKGLEQNAGW